MNILLWIVQALLALLCVSGGAYKASKPDELTKQTRALSPGRWRAIGLLEIACGILLIVPAVVNSMPVLVPIAAAAVVLEALALSALYARVSVKLVAANPLVWSMVMVVMAVVVAYGRY